MNEREYLTITGYFICRFPDLSTRAQRSLRVSLGWLLKNSILWNTISGQVLYHDVKRSLPIAAGLRGETRVEQYQGDRHVKTFTTWQQKYDVRAAKDNTFHLSPDSIVSVDKAYIVLQKAEFIG